MSDLSLYKYCKQSQIYTVMMMMILDVLNPFQFLQNFEKISLLSPLFKSSQTKSTVSKKKKILERYADAEDSSSELDVLQNKG